MGNENINSEWVDNDYLELLPSVIGHTVIPPDRLRMLWQFAKNKTGGVAAEFGVYAGGSAKIIYKALRGTLHLFDSFEGLPDAGEYDLHRRGDFSDVNFNDVKHYLSDCPNIHYHVGWFNEIQKPDIKYDFVHIDADLYESTNQALEYFYPRMKPGGIMIFDDYYWEGTPGVRKAIYDFLCNKKEYCINLHNYQGLIINGDIC